MTRLLPFVLALSACSPPPEPPRLQSYGAFNPVCIILCKAATNSADLEGSSQQNISTSSDVSKSP